MSINSNSVYKIINAKAETVLDLSGTDGTSISGYTDNDGGNQKWHLQQDENGHWTFRNLATGKYLGYIAGSGLTDGLPLVGIDNPVLWDIYPDDDDRGAFRIFVPGAPAPLNVDLADHGNPNPGTPVTLWGKWAGKNQVWRFQQV